MSSRLILVAVTALTFAAPALAQTPAQTAAPAPAAASADAAVAPAPTEEDVEAAGEAFEADMQKLAEEVDAAKAAAGADTAKADADIDALIARHQPVADAFADTLGAFIQTMAGMIPAEQMAAMPTMLEQVRSAPSQVRANRATPPGPALP